MLNLEQIAIPCMRDDGSFAVKIPFFLEDHTSDTGIKELRTLLMLAPASVTWQLSQRRGGGRELDILGPESDQIHIIALRVIEKIREMGDLIPDEPEEQVAKVAFVGGHESDWEYEPPEGGEHDGADHPEYDQHHRTTDKSGRRPA